MRKLAIAAGALVALLIVAMITIPLFVNVDKYRPEIVSAVNQKINGTLELGHLDLSLWGQVKIGIEGLSLKDAAGKNIVSVQNAYFHLPFISLLSGSPVIELAMDHPVVNVVKNRAGKLNVMTLMKAEAPLGGASTPNTSSVPSAPGATTAPGAKEVALPAIAANARLGFDLSGATIDYADETRALSTQMKDLNVVVKDLSLSHPSRIAAWSIFDTTLGTSLSLKGPARVDLEMSPQVSGGKLVEFALNGKVNLDQLAISMPGTFEKKAGVPANVELAIKGSMNGVSQEIDVEKADVQFFNARVQSKGTITGLPARPIVHYSLKSNDIELSSWTELLPMLSQYQLGGKANLSAEVGGESTKLSYQARIGVDGLTAKAPMLKAQPRIDGSIVIATDQVQKLEITMTAPGNDLKISGRVLSFTAPQATFDVTSSGMDLDQLIDFKALQAQKKSGSAMSLVPSAYAERTEKPQTDMDVMLDPIRTNKMIARTTANINMNIRMLKAENAKMMDITGKIYFKDLAAGLQNFSMKVFGGSVQASAACQLRPQQPTYKFSAKVNGLDLGQAVQSQMAMFKNTATGKADFDIAGEGSSFNPEPAKAHLRAKGSMKIANAQLTTIDVGKMAVDGITDALSKISSRIPGLVKNLHLPHRSSKYQFISSDFGISGGKFSAPNLVGKAEPQQGIDFKGSAQVGLKDQSIDAKIQIIDTYNYLTIKDKAPQLCERGKPFVLPVGVGCTLQSPCYSYQDSAEYLVKVAMNNMTGQIKEKAQSQIENSLKKALGGSVGGGAPNIGKALKGLFGN